MIQLFKPLVSHFFPASVSAVKPKVDLTRFAKLIQMRTVRRYLPHAEVHVYVMQTRQRKIRSSSLLYLFSIVPKSMLHIKQFSFAEWTEWEDVPLIDESTNTELSTFHTLSERKIVTVETNLDPSKLDNIQTRVQKILAEQLGVAENEIKPDTNFFDDLNADSLDAVEMIMSLEDEFEIEIPDEDGADFTTMQKVVNYLATK